MRLWLVRHAPALPAEPRGDDALRPLSAAGRARFEATVRRLGEEELALAALLHGPWRRATETADLFAPLLAEGALVRAEEGLARPPGAELLRRLAHLERDPVALVGHQPWLGELLALLVTGDAGHGAGFPLAKGGLAELEGAPRPRGMRLRALRRPHREAGGR